MSWGPSFGSCVLVWRCDSSRPHKHQRVKNFGNRGIARRGHAARGPSTLAASSRPRTPFSLKPESFCPKGAGSPARGNAMGLVRDRHRAMSGRPMMTPNREWTREVRDPLGVAFLEGADPWRCHGLSADRPLRSVRSDAIPLTFSDEWARFFTGGPFACHPELQQKWHQIFGIARRVW
jgi:hypothetical protein